MREKNVLDFELKSEIGQHTARLLDLCRKECLIFEQHSTFHTENLANETFS